MAFTRPIYSDHDPAKVAPEPIIHIDRLSKSQLVSLPADAKDGSLTSGTYTLAAIAGTVTSIAAPDWARGFRLYPKSEVRFAVNEDPAAAGANALTVGGFALDLAWETRLLPPGTGRTLRLRSETASAEVDVEFFA